MLDSYRKTWVETVVAFAAIANLGRGRLPAKRIVPLNTKRFARGCPHQGWREMARRRRQIASGMLTAANGLAVA